MTIEQLRSRTGWEILRAGDDWYDAHTPLGWVCGETAEDLEREYDRLWCLTMRELFRSSGITDLDDNE